MCKFGKFCGKTTDIDYASLVQMATAVIVWPYLQNYACHDEIAVYLRESDAAELQGVLSHDARHRCYRIPKALSIADLLSAMKLVGWKQDSFNTRSHHESVCGVYHLSKEITE